MKKLPQVAHRVSLDRSLRLKKSTPNVFDRLLVESQSISIDSNKALL